MSRAFITGCGAISPLGLDWDSWVQGLKNGTSGTRRITAFDPDFPVVGCPDIEALPCQVAAEVLDFDPMRWIGDKDRDRVPRVVPMAIAAAHEALQRAGLGEITDEQKRATGVLIGSGGGGFSFAEEQFKLWLGGASKRVSPYAISSSIAGMVSSEVSIAFGLHGRSHTISDGCTSASDALGYALDLIRNGRAKRLIVGGADAPVTPAFIAGFCLMRAVPTKWNEEPGRASRPFDQNRDGFVLGEGAWMFIVESEEAAHERGATPIAEICGYGATCEAYHRVALGSPDEAARAMSEALQDAQIAPKAVDYINLHGTATPMNDPLESAAVRRAFGEHADKIPASSTKSQIGHPQGASGAAGVAATIAAMQNDFLPPTINLENRAEGCDLDYIPNEARDGKVEVALCNCLGFGSKNAAVVLKRAS